MRVLAVHNREPGRASGGYERILTGTLAALQAAGHEVTLLTADGGELEWYWRDGTFPRVPLRRRLAIEHHNAAVLRRHLEHADVVSWWGMGGMSLSLVEQARRAGLPAVGVVGDGWMVYGPEADGWTRGWRRAGPLAAVAERASGIPARLDLGAGARWLFISDVARNRALQAGHALPDTGLAHPGVDPDAFPVAPVGAWRGRLACIGRVEPRKGIATAVESLAGLRDATLVVDGPDEGGHRAELEALARRLGVEERVRFTVTPAERVAEAYAAADAVLFPVTWPEPWGLVPLEAMAVGRPVIATGTGGSAEYLEDGENALLVRPGDATALAGAVRRLALDASLRERLVSSGRRTASRFSQAEFEATVVAELERAAEVRAQAP